MNRNNRNEHGVKYSSDCYRNIGGVRFENWSSNPADFDRIKKEAKEKKLRTRIINQEIYLEVIPVDDYEDVDFNKLKLVS